ncbi:MAG: S49 family peptidase [Methylococcaceae bacterium]|nr:S49 family peptidase [Methylococcaceae bacterium]
MTDPTTHAVLLEILRTNSEELKRTRRWHLILRMLSSGFMLLLVGLSLFAWWKSYTATHQPHAAVVRIEGEIAANSKAGADAVITGLRSAFAASEAKAVVIEINSPGGSPVQAGMIHDEIKRLRGKHPDKSVVAVIDDMGASGGYYVAVAADRIFANPASLVGSIGVRLDSFGFTDAMNRLGVERRLYTAGKYKGVMDMFTPVDPAAETQIHGMLDTVHRQFINAVKSGRGSRLKDDPILFTGMFWSGEEGLQLGLIDGFGDRRQIIEQEFNLDTVLDYTQAEDVFKQLGKFQTSISLLMSTLSGVPALR